MTISLGPVTLDESLVLRGLSDSQDIAIGEYITLQGGVNIQTAPVQAGQPLTLTTVRIGNGIRGYFTRQQVEDIRDLQAIGQPTTLIHHFGTFTVFIKSLGVFTPLREYSDGEATDKGSFSVILTKL